VGNEKVIQKLLMEMEACNYSFDDVEICTFPSHEANGNITGMGPIP